MGYILPISFESYQQYSLRDMREDINPFRADQIGRTGKASLFQTNTLPVHKTSLELKKKVEPVNGSIDKMYAELTGIGRRFDRKV
ncbi:hypothetical protein ACQYAD_06995 [Neobacillus sp. SM06]|uniref:hypothetical protein n=1 Tax=Neobacillus sp. SM06 TaxID=3422492 RepID=UPI003D2B635A